MRGLKLCVLGCLAAAVLTGCGALPGMEHTDTQEAQVGDVVSTAWFDYTVTRAEAADAYEGRTAPEGSRLVVVELTLENRFDEPVPMFDTDFQLYWGEYGEDQWALPEEVFCQAQFPESYQLSVGEERTGVLVYQVPEDVQDFTLAFLEVFDNGTDEGEEGDISLTRFTVP